MTTINIFKDERVHLFPSVTNRGELNYSVFDLVVRHIC